MYGTFHSIIWSLIRIPGHWKSTRWLSQPIYSGRLIMSTSLALLTHFQIFYNLWSLSFHCPLHQMRHTPNYSKSFFILSKKLLSVPTTDCGNRVCPHNVSQYVISLYNILSNLIDLYGSLTQAPLATVSQFIWVPPEPPKIPALIIILDSKNEKQLELAYNLSVQKVPVWPRPPIFGNDTNDITVVCSQWYLSGFRKCCLSVELISCEMTTSRAKRLVHVFGKAFKVTIRLQNLMKIRSGVLGNLQKTLITLNRCLENLHSVHIRGRAPCNIFKWLCLICPRGKSSRAASRYLTCRLSPRATRLGPPQSKVWLLLQRRPTSPNFKILSRFRHTNREKRFKCKFNELKQREKKTS